MLGEKLGKSELRSLTQGLCWDLFCAGELALGGRDPGPDTSCDDCGGGHPQGTCPRPWTAELTSQAA